jgi:Syntaxin 6, N-terminal
MSVDPYHAVQSEIQSSLATAEQLRASFLRIRSTAHEGNEELEWARNEVSAEYVLIRAGIILTACCPLVSSRQRFLRWKLTWKL